MGCPDLEKKPKLFILQACRGGELSFEGASPIRSMNGRMISGTSANVSPIQYTSDTVDIVNGLNTGVLKYHMVADTSEFWACPPGNSAYRSSKVSYFIDVFCSTVDRFGDKEDYATIVRKVNKEMTNHPQLILKVNGMKQSVCLASYHEGCLTRNVRFFEVKNRSRCKFQLTKSPIVALIVFFLITLIVVPTVSVLCSKPSSTDSNQPSSTVLNEFSHPNFTESKQPNSTLGYEVLQPNSTVLTEFSQPSPTSSNEFVQSNLTDSTQSSLTIPFELSQPIPTSLTGVSQPNPIESTQLNYIPSEHSLIENVATCLFFIGVLSLIVHLFICIEFPHNESCSLVKQELVTRNIFVFFLASIVIYDIAYDLDLR